MELAGFFTAHAVWTVTLQKGALPPMLVTESAGERTLLRFDKEESMELAVDKARELLEASAKDTERGIVLYDAFVTLNDEQYDAIIVQGLEHLPGDLKVEIVQPYRPPNADGGFAVMQPKVSFPQAQVGFAEELTEAFFRGLDSHEEGGPIWTQSILAAG